MIEAVLFDFNGVIADDEEQHREALGGVLAEQGLPLTREQYYADFLGFDDRRCLIQAFRRAGRRLPASQLEQLLAAKSQIYQRLIDRSLALVPGAAEFVPRAAGRFRLGVVSGALRRGVGPVLGPAGLRRPFRVVGGAPGGAPPPPPPPRPRPPRSPASTRAACRRHGSPPSAPAQSSRAPTRPWSRSPGPARSRAPRDSSLTTWRSLETGRSCMEPCSPPRA